MKFGILAESKSPLRKRGLDASERKLAFQIAQLAGSEMRQFLLRRRLVFWLDPLTALTWQNYSKLRASTLRQLLAQLVAKLTRLPAIIPLPKMRLNWGEVEKELLALRTGSVSFPPEGQFAFPASCKINPTAQSYPQGSKPDQKHPLPWQA